MIRHHDMTSRTFHVLKYVICNTTYRMTENLKTVCFQNEPTSLHCKRCSKVWKYKGNNPYVASCPYCKTTVTIRRHKVLQTGHGFETLGQFVATEQPSMIGGNPTNG
jgi:Zn finger protein HypA/HybF involved in hydrogenase expression